ncbi:hypothetical protein C8R46DRAFT_1002214 [Mycena filopes]|nr:hypothetical protein C8R46DRAFT_1002214 [Mycena filopes]
MRFQMNEIYSSRRGPNVDVVQTTQDINMCPPPSRIFHGRQTILDHIHQFFTGGSEKQLIYVLYGLGGIGKTQTARKFIQDSSAHFTSIFLVDASNPDTIESGLKTIAKPADSLDAALDWFKAKHENWLLFFDNADDPKLDLNRFIPNCNHGNIMITSRNPEVRGYGGGYWEVSGMEEVDAISLLLERAKKESSEDNHKIAAEIAKELGYLPLAIDQAGAFILKSGDLSGYLALYHKKQTYLLKQKASQSHADYKWTVYTTWQISFDRLSEQAAILLQLCSFLHHTGISEDIFSNASKYSFPSWKPSKEELKEPLKFLSHFLEPTGEWDSLHFLTVTNEIKAYSLINFDAKSRMYSIHPLVHSWTRSTLADEGSCLTCISSILGMAVTNVPNTDIQQTALKFIPHLGSLKVMELSEGNSFQMEFWLIYHCGFRLQEARNIAEEMLYKCKVLFGEEHEATLEIMGKLALTYRRLGEYKRAEELQTVVLEKRSEQFGEDDLDTVQAMGGLASTYSDLGEYKRAEKLDTMVLEKWTKLLGKDHPDTVWAMGNLASTYRDLGEYKRAEELQTLVLQKRTKLFGKDHPDTVQAMANLAATYRDLGEHKRAEELETVVLEKQTEHFGGDHPNTVQAMANLAATYSDLGEYKRAEELQTMVLQKRTKLFGEDHPNAVQAMANLALTYRNLGEYQRSEELQTVVLEKQTKLLGGDHPNTVRAMANLAVTYSDLGEHKRAEELQTVVLEIRTKLFGEDHPATVGAMANLAATYHDLGEHKRAEELETVVLQKRTKLFGEDHPDTVRAMANLAATYRGLGEHKRAEELETVVLEKQTEHFGGDHPNTVWAMANLAATYYNQGEYKRAEELETVVLEKRRKLLGNKHPHTIRAMRNLALTYKELGKLRELAELEQLIQDSKLH